MIYLHDCVNLFLLPYFHQAWLCDIERTMRWTLKDVLKQCKVSLKKNLSKRDKWVKEWPGQVCLEIVKVYFYFHCTSGLQRNLDSSHMVFSRRIPMQINRLDPSIGMSKSTCYYYESTIRVLKSSATSSAIKLILPLLLRSPKTF